MELASCAMVLLEGRLVSKKKYETAKEFEIPKDYQISVLLASMASKAMLVLMPEVFLEDVPGASGMEWKESMV